MNKAKFEDKLTNKNKYTKNNEYNVEKLILKLNKSTCKNMKKEDNKVEKILLLNEEKLI